MRYIFLIVGIYNFTDSAINKIIMRLLWPLVLGIISLSYLFQLLIDPWALVNIIVTFRHRACLLVRLYVILFRTLFIGIRFMDFSNFGSIK